MKMYTTRIVEPSLASLSEAASLLRHGELVAFPTETVYGLGANALDPVAVQRIFAAKNRPADNPLIVHIAKKEQFLFLTKTISKKIEALISAFWPGPLTLVVPAVDGIPKDVTAGLDTVGIRMPDHPVALALLEAAGLPIAAPSANASGRPSPTTASHVLDDLRGRIPLILDGGPCRTGLESTVLDVTGEIPIVLRPGAITPEMIRQHTGEVRVHESALSPLVDPSQAASPGMKYRHYAPNCEVILFTGPVAFTSMRERYDTAQAQGRIPVLIAPEERKGELDGRRWLPLGDQSHPESAARALFAVLREAETLGADIVLIEGIEPEGVGLAVMNRLYRAAGFRVEA